MAVKRSKRDQSGGMSDRVKKTLIISISSAALIAVGVWAYLTFTTVPPPHLDQASVEQVTAFMVNPRGIQRMSIDDRQQYIADALRRFSSPADRQQFHRNLARLSSSDRQVLEDATFDIARVRVMQKAREYNSLPPSQQRQFVDSAIREFEGMRSQFSLGGPGGQSLGDAFKGDMPKGNDEWMKYAVVKTSPRERSDAQNFVDALTAREKELKDPREKQRFMAGR